MAEHVEVVIRIPKYYLTHPQDYTCLAECVRRGTILPEHHGRLIDAGALMKEAVFISNEDESYSFVYAENIADTPTIIEGSDSE